MDLENLKRYSAFFLDVNGFILGHIVFEDILTSKKIAYWMPKSIYSKVSVFPRPSLSDYVKSNGKPFPKAPIDIDPIKLQKAAEDVIVSYFTSSEVIEIRSILKIR